jgi:hypothetical protein
VENVIALCAYDVLVRSIGLLPFFVADWAFGFVTRRAGWKEMVAYTIAEVICDGRHVGMRVEYYGQFSLVGSGMKGYACLSEANKYSCRKMVFSVEYHFHGIIHGSLIENSWYGHL